MHKGVNMTQYEAATRKRTITAAIIIFVFMPTTVIAGTFLFGQNLYMVFGLLVIIYAMIPFFMVFERRKPKAREIVLIAMMAALTTVIHLFFHMTVPIKGGTAMVIISGIALGPEAGFLIGALSRFVCNFYMGQGPFTPWQMFCWGILGFLAGMVFNKDCMDEIKSRNLRMVAGPVASIVVALLAAYVIYLIWPTDEGFIGWRLYLFGFIGLIVGLLIQRGRLPIDGITMALFTFFVTFIIYGGIMNVSAMVTSSVVPDGRPISWDTLKLLYISGAPYDLLHAGTAAMFIFLFGDTFIRKLERIKIKYGIYR